MTAMRSTDRPETDRARGGGVEGEGRGGSRAASERNGPDQLRGHEKVERIRKRKRNEKKKREKERGNEMKQEKKK